MEQLPDPSPDEIRQACAKIREGWTDSERMARCEKLPPAQPCDYVGVQAAAEVKAEDRQAVRRGAMAS